MASTLRDIIASRLMLSNRSSGNSTCAASLFDLLWYFSRHFANTLVVLHKLMMQPLISWHTSTVRHAGTLQMSLVLRTRSDSTFVVFAGPMVRVSQTHQPGAWCKQLIKTKLAFQMHVVRDGVQHDGQENRKGDPL